MNDVHKSAVRISFRGHVQGVGFRYATLRLAQRFPAISGYVRNMPDGSVELFAQGPPHDVEAFLNDICTGPHAAHIHETIRHPAATTDRFKEFRIAF